MDMLVVVVWGAAAEASTEALELPGWVEDEPRNLTARGVCGRA